MKISEMIKQLERTKGVYGDLDIQINILGLEDGCHCSKVNSMSIDWDDSEKKRVLGISTILD